jgi:hypothetical protein
MRPSPLMPVSSPRMCRATMAMLIWIGEPKLALPIRRLAGTRFRTRVLHAQPGGVIKERHFQAELSFTCYDHSPSNSRADCRRRCRSRRPCSGTAHNAPGAQIPQLGHARCGAQSPSCDDWKSLADPATQHALVGLLERESNDPQWEGKAEFLGYEDYYESLCGAVQQIAVKYNNAEAWKVLLRSNYDEDSRFAKWIAAQPEAVNYLFALTSDKNEMVRARASFVLAEALARCKPALLDASCVTILDNEKAVLEILRKNAQDSRFPVTRYKAIKALGLCGTEEDLALLDELNRGDTDRWFALTVRQAKQKIESRVKK